MAFSCEAKEVIWWCGKILESFGGALKLGRWPKRMEMNLLGDEGAEVTVWKVLGAWCIRRFC